MITQDATGGARDGQGLDAIRQEAAQWIVRLQEAGPGERERLHDECERWQGADPRHRRVFAQMQQLWDAGEILRRRRGRRRALAGLGLVVAATLLLGQLPWAYWGADYRTAAGEIRELTLPDGSRAVLDTDSAIDVRYGEQARAVRLVRGEVMMTVSDDAEGRPFRVRGPHGSAEAVGTAYRVRLEKGQSLVAVHEHRVRLIPRRDATAAVTLRAGQRARLTGTAVTDVEAIPPGPPDWVRRRLVFNDAALAEVLERLDRYRAGLLLMPDAVAARGLRFTGVLPADDSDAALALLADSLDLRVRQVTPYVVWLETGR